MVLLPLIRDGKLRALGVTSASRKSELPDTPTMVEAGVPGFIATLLTGIVAPAGTPAAHRRQAQRRDQRDARRPPTCASC